MYREDLIIPLVHNKKVLDCGGIDHDHAEMKVTRGDWLHALIAQHASSCLGVDILKDRVEQINAQGQYTFITANVEALPFDHEFDVVVAGDIVEHLYNMGLFLSSAWKALQDHGILIITTPNCYALSSLAYVLLKRQELCHPEHTCYYSKQTLSYMIKKHGFAIEQLHILPRPARSRMVGHIRAFLCKLYPNLGEKLVMIARKQIVQEKYENLW